MNLRRTCNRLNLGRRVRSADAEGGWTFLETLIVIAIIFILTGTVGLSAFKYLSRAKTAAARNEIELYSLALTAYYLDCSVYPSREQGLNALWEKPILEPIPAGWQGPYLDKAPDSDPWGNGYVYRQPGPAGLGFEVMSYGADGRPGGDGNAEDIVSWR